MSATWFVPELGVDFIDDPEDMMIDYIFSKWSIFNPAKGAAKRDNSSNDFIRFHTGYLDYSKSYEIAMTSVNTSLDKGKKGSMPPRYNYFVTSLNIQIRMQRSQTSPEEIQDELGNMEREIGRIARNYREDEVLGVKAFYMPESDRSTPIINEYSVSNWQSNVIAKVEYWKYNTKPQV